MSKLSTEKKFLFGLGLYIILHLLFRVFVSNSLEKDEAEMILYTQQSLSWGYNSQPPLYVWLQLAFFRILGLSVLPLALLKNILIFLIYFFLYKSAKIILKDELPAILSTVSLLLIYNFSWIMHKDLTHTILLMAICSLTLYTLLKSIFTKRAFYYAVLGLAIGLGLLTKYNYAIFVLALLFSAISVSQYRSAILNKKMLITLGITLFITAGHFSWCINSPELLMSDIADFQRADGSKAVLGSKGLLSLLEQTFLFIIPLIVMYAAFFFKPFIKVFKKTQNKQEIQKLLRNFFIFSFIIVIALIISANVGRVKTRWLGPLLFLVPLYFFTRAQNHKITKKQNIAFLSLVIFCAIATLFSVWGRVLFASSRGKYSRLNYPYTELAKMIKDEGFKNGLIIAEDQVIGANLKIYFKDSFVTVAQEKLAKVALKDQKNILIIWEDAISNSFSDGVEEAIEHYRLKEEDPIVKKALYKYSKDDYYHLNMFIVKKENI